ncbi:chloride channel protein EriC [Clostridium chromiireducens]|uniref:Chloride channel protein EriC n=1 Tax=Clostridium chromiireducens TaxID=225345 RepID=A0A964W3S6_9CLOT|nr:voltage-gated chloride channel family protein [Clostridium chromiireducens]MVX65453.1 chloride channel protein EriC [Clostridium chromiireducens]
MHKRNSKILRTTLFIKNLNMSTILGLSFFKWIIISTIVGSLVGSAAAFFLKSLDIATTLRNDNPWLLFLLPIGGALVSFLYSKYGKNSSKGNNLIIDKINTSKDHIPLRMAPLVFFGTFITHLFGGSAGREGTGVQIGSSIAESIGKLLNLDKTDTKIILMCGISSGFGSVFGTPLAGTIFGLEVAALGTMNYAGLIPCFISAFVGNIMTEVWGIHHTHYSVLQIPDITYSSVLKVVIAAILFGLISKLFSELTHKLKEVFTSGFENASIKSFIGGLIIIAFTYMIGTRDYLGLSIPLINDSFTGHVNPFAFLLKIIFTSFTLGTGFQGGEVTPLFVIGSTFGNTLSSILNISPSLLAALGLIGVFSGATNAPIASFVLGLEMFGSAGMEFMFMTCAISYLFSGHSGIYTSQKIGISKSRLIKVPQESTLAYYRKKKVDEKKSNDNHILISQFKFGVSSIELPSIEGLNMYKIKCNRKGVRLVHRSYNPDGGTWSANPIKGQLKYIKLKDNTEEIHAINVSESYGQKDKLFLINTNLFNSVEVQYSLQKHHSKHDYKNNVINDDEYDDYDSESKEVNLKNQFRLLKSIIELPNPKGEIIYNISVNGGKVRLNHNSYNPDGGTWSSPPSKDQVQHIDLYEGEHKIKLCIEEHFGHNDKITLVNTNFNNSVDITYNVEKIIDELNFENLS